MYNLYDDEEEEEPAAREVSEENVKTKEKMELLRSKMENLTVTKKVGNLLLVPIGSSLREIIIDKKFRLCKQM